MRWLLLAALVGCDGFTSYFTIDPHDAVSASVDGGPAYTAVFTLEESYTDVDEAVRHQTPVTFVLGDGTTITLSLRTLCCAGSYDAATAQYDFVSHLVEFGRDDGPGLSGAGNCALDGKVGYQWQTGVISCVSL